MRYDFVMDDRLGILLPSLQLEWEEYTDSERADILLRWEEIRGTIPDRVKQLENIIIEKQEQLNVEENFQISCALNSEIAELASVINDLHLWFRVNQDISAKAHH